MDGGWGGGHIMGGGVGVTFTVNSKQPCGTSEFAHLNLHFTYLQLIKILPGRLPKTVFSTKLKRSHRYV